jgi:uncharacterized protein (TIGR02118 family)
MYKTIFLLKRKPGTTLEEFREYWLEAHVPVVLEIAEVRGFVCNVVEDGGSADPKPYDGLAEIWWDDEASFTAALASPAGQAAVEDVERFTASHDHIVLDEHVALAPQRG